MECLLFYYEQGSSSFLKLCVVVCGGVWCVVVVMGVRERGLKVDKITVSMFILLHL